MLIQFAPFLVLLELVAGGSGSPNYPVIDARTLDYNVIDCMLVRMSFARSPTENSEHDLWVFRDTDFKMTEEPCANLKFTLKFNKAVDIFGALFNISRIRTPRVSQEINSAYIILVTLDTRISFGRVIFKLFTPIDITPHFFFATGTGHRWRWEQKNPNWHNEMIFVPPLPKRRLESNEISWRMKEYPEGNRFDRMWYHSEK